MRDGAGRAELISMEGNFEGEVVGCITEGVFWGDSYHRGEVFSVEEQYTKLLTAGKAHFGVPATTSEGRINGIGTTDMMLEAWQDNTNWGGHGYVNDKMEVDRQEEEGVRPGSELVLGVLGAGWSSKGATGTATEDRNDLVVAGIERYDP
ncbi:hypothetical protein F5876DRAFT_70215 [Lentinula aff. lateritia]|uniref:Uncharacterized protein n=1 Tax=Lentinula aff. lateritia TaxID=2804960 RepID=A0ACC1TK69_9AGAR|nr:hypothetical protein F5876DRAFT_70215 [Lentinula aff. lateritia]